MEEFHMISEQTVKESNVRLISLTEKAFQLHDALKEGEMSLQPSSPESVSFRQQYNDTLDMIQQQVRLLLFDPNRSWDDYRLDHRELKAAWDRLSPEIKWKKHIIITVYYWFFAKGETMPFDFLEELWNTKAPKSMRDDRDIIFCRLSVTEIRRSTPFLCTSNEQMPHFFHLPVEVWNDKAIVLVAVQRFPEVLIQKLVPDHFLNDEEVFSAFVGVKDAVSIRCDDGYGPLTPWQDEDFLRLVPQFSKHIRANAQLMLALLQKSGVCVHHVDELLKGSCALIQAACIQNPLALNYCDSRLVEQLLHDKAFVLSVLDARPADPKYSGPPFEAAVASRQFYMSLPEQMRRDVDIAGVMLRKGYLTVDQFPDTLRGRDFWLNACHYADSSLWRQLPVFFKDDPEFLATIRFQHATVVELAIDDVPRLAGSKAFWTAVFKSKKINSGYTASLLRNLAAPEIRQDRDLMRLACIQDYHVFGLLDDILQEDGEILRAMVEANITSAFEVIPMRIQSMYPNHTAKAIRSLVVGPETLYLSDFPEDLSTNLEVMMAYVDYNTYDMPSWTIQVSDAMQDNEDFGVFAAKLTLQRKNDVSSFSQYTSTSLRSNKAFMMKAVTHNPVCLAAGIGDLSTDFDLAVMAFSQKIYCSARLFGCHEEQDDYDYSSELEFLHSVATKAREKVRLYEWHRRVFIPVFDNPDYTPGPDCLMPIMFQDDETGLELKKKMLIYLGGNPITGIPDEAQISRLRAASLYLLFMPNNLRPFDEDPNLMPKPERFFNCE